jgi:hypothetical protein
MRRACERCLRTTSHRESERMLGKIKVHDVEPATPAQRDLLQLIAENLHLSIKLLFKLAPRNFEELRRRRRD